MKRNSQSRIEHQKTEPAAPKNPATSGKAQSNQHHCGSPGKRGRFPGTQMQQNKPSDGQIMPSL